MARRRSRGPSRLTRPRRRVADWRLPDVVKWVMSQSSLSTEEPGREVAPAPGEPDDDEAAVERAALLKAALSQKQVERRRHHSDPVQCVARIGSRGGVRLLGRRSRHVEIIDEALPGSAAPARSPRRRARSLLKIDTCKLPGSADVSLQLYAVRMRALTVAAGRSLSTCRCWPAGLPGDERLTASSGKHHRRRHRPDPGLINKTRFAPSRPKAALLSQRPISNPQRTEADRSGTERGRPRARYSPARRRARRGEAARGRWRPPRSPNTGRRAPPARRA